MALKSPLLFKVENYVKIKKWFNGSKTKKGMFVLGSMKAISIIFFLPGFAFKDRKKKKTSISMHLPPDMVGSFSALF